MSIQNYGIPPSATLVTRLASGERFKLPGFVFLNRARVTLVCLWRSPALQRLESPAFDLFELVFLHARAYCLVFVRLCDLPHPRRAHRAPAFHHNSAVAVHHSESI